MIGSGRECGGIYHNFDNYYYLLLEMIYENFHQLKKMKKKKKMKKIKKKTNPPATHVTIVAPPANFLSKQKKTRFANKKKEKTKFRDIFSFPVQIKKNK